jgi:hypothetical protein
MTKARIALLIGLACPLLTACQGFFGTHGANAQGAAGIPQKCDTKVTLSWVAPTQNVDGTAITDLAGYRIYYGNASHVYSQIIDISDPAATSKDISSLAPGTYFFAATAYAVRNNITAESDYSNESAINLVTCSHTYLNLITGKYSQVLEVR